MQLHELGGSRQKNKRRIGRGGKRGTTSGRGQKGQKSRSGHRIRPAARDLILRLPKRRGFRNKPKNPKPTVFNLADLSSALKVSENTKAPILLNRDFLIQAGLLKPNYAGNVKILGGGDIAVPVTVGGLMVSKSAKEKIEKAGGKIV
jgi:large subunit ribosomal protein L15